MELNITFREQVQQVYEQQSQFFKLLTHPARLAILNVLREDEACVCHLEAVLGFRQAYISQQLAVLREAGLIQDRRDGWNIYYRVCEPRVFEVLNAVEKILYPVDLPVLSRHAKNCPCPKCSAPADA